MIKKKILYLSILLSVFIALPTLAEDAVVLAASQSEYDDLSQQIKILEDERDKYRAKAARALDQGDRLQFEEGMLTDARRYWVMAESYTEIADKIDGQILELKKRREALLQKKS
jgi:type III secretory pathway component EscR